MKLSFYIDYRTHWGESLYITGDVPVMGDGDESKAVKMELKGEQTWVVTLDVDDSAMRFDYRYLVRNENGGVIREWGLSHMLYGQKGHAPAQLTSMTDGRTSRGTSRFTRRRLSTVSVTA